MARDFYKTTIHYVVLSEEPIPPHVDLEYIGREASEGRYVGQFDVPDEVLLNGAAMADELFKAGSEPGFFELDENGNDADPGDETPTAEDAFIKGATWGLECSHAPDSDTLPCLKDADADCPYPELECHMEAKVAVVSPESKHQVAVGSENPRPRLARLLMIRDFSGSMNTSDLGLRKKG